jgi:hypothetical protein
MAQVVEHLKCEDLSSISSNLPPPIQQKSSPIGQIKQKKECQGLKIRLRNHYIQKIRKEKYRQSSPQTSRAMGHYQETKPKNLYDGRN